MSSHRLTYVIDIQQAHLVFLDVETCGDAQVLLLFIEIVLFSGVSIQRICICNVRNVSLETSFSFLDHI
jgi:hypothetical protein